MQTTFIQVLIYTTIVHLIVGLIAAGVYKWFLKLPIEDEKFTALNYIYNVDAIIKWLRWCPLLNLIVIIDIGNKIRRYYHNKRVDKKLLKILKPLKPIFEKIADKELESIDSKIAATKLLDTIDELDNNIKNN